VRTATTIRAVIISALVTAAAVVLTACGGDPVGWSDIRTAPGAETFECAQIETPIDQRLSSIVSERELTVVGSRLEHLPAGVDWAAHLRWRDQHDGGMRKIDALLPEPDAPVLVAEFAKGDRTLVVIGKADTSGKRLVVLTTLLQK
ncbi:MAG: hypothetical protein ACRCYU_02955, partial [Nocardioides sp.]